MFFKINSITNKVEEASNFPVAEEENYYIVESFNSYVYNYWYNHSYINGDFIENIDTVNPQFFIYNDSLVIGKDNFKNTFNYNLKSVVADSDINSRGDLIHQKWYRGDVLAIEEFRDYTRTLSIESHVENFTLSKETTVRFFKWGGGYVDIDLDTRVYNDNDRKIRDSKARDNIIEKTRKATGEYIKQKLIANNTPELILQTVEEAKLIFGILNSEIAQYRKDRLSEPLLEALAVYPLTAFMTQDILQYIASILDVEYYDILL